MEMAMSPTSNGDWGGVWNLNPISCSISSSTSSSAPSLDTSPTFHFFRPFSCLRSDGDLLEPVLPPLMPDGLTAAAANQSNDDHDNEGADMLCDDASPSSTGFRPVTREEPTRMEDVKVPALLPVMSMDMPSVETATPSFGEEPIRMEDVKVPALLPAMPSVETAALLPAMPSEETAATSPFIPPVMAMTLPPITAAVVPPIMAAVVPPVMATVVPPVMAAGSTIAAEASDTKATVLKPRCSRSNGPSAAYQKLIYQTMRLPIDGILTNQRPRQTTRSSTVAAAAAAAATAAAASKPTGDDQSADDEDSASDTNESADDLDTSDDDSDCNRASKRPRHDGPDFKVGGGGGGGETDSCSRTAETSTDARKALHVAIKDLQERIKIGTAKSPTDELHRLLRELSPFRFALTSQTLARYKLSIPMAASELPRPPADANTPLTMHKFRLLDPIFRQHMLFVECQIGPDECISFACKIIKNLTGHQPGSAYFQAREFVFAPSSSASTSHVRVSSGHSHPIRCAVGGEVRLAPTATRQSKIPKHRRCEEGKRVQAAGRPLKCFLSFTAGRAVDITVYCSNAFRPTLRVLRKVRRTCDSRRLEPDTLQTIEYIESSREAAASIPAAVAASASALAAPAAAPPAAKAPTPIAAPFVGHARKKAKVEHKIAQLTMTTRSNDLPRAKRRRSVVSH